MTSVLASADTAPGVAAGGVTRTTDTRWYPLLRRIAREVVLPPGPVVDLDALTRRLHAAYFHGHADPAAWPPRADAALLSRPSGSGDGSVTRLAITSPGRPRPRRHGLGRFGAHGTPRSGEPGGPTARCYLHLLPDSAPQVFTDIATRLRGHGIAFAGKLLDTPRGVGSSGLAVFSVNRADAAALASGAIATCTPRGRGTGVPAFTRELALGIAIADDPGNGIGFGYHRCGLIARGLGSVGAADPHERLSAIIASFLQAGIDPARPHLGPHLREFDVDEVSR